MKKEWTEPKLGLLDISKTMGHLFGDSWDGKFIGREWSGGEGDESGGDIGS